MVGLGKFRLKAYPEPYSRDVLAGVVDERYTAENGDIILLHSKVYLFVHTSAKGNDIVHVQLRSAISGCIIYIQI